VADDRTGQAAAHRNSDARTAGGRGPGRGPRLRRLPYGYLVFLHGVRTDQPPPLSLGHEISGVVVAGDARVLGKEVIIPAVLPCNKCELCKSGRGNRCLAQKMPGNSMGIYGGFSSHIPVPAVDLCIVGNRGDIPLEHLSVIADAVTTPYQAGHSRPPAGRRPSHCDRRRRWRRQLHDPGSQGHGRQHGNRHRHQRGKTRIHEGLWRRLYDQPEGQEPEGSEGKFQGLLQGKGYSLELRLEDLRSHWHQSPARNWPWPCCPLPAC